MIFVTVGPRSRWPAFIPGPSFFLVTIDSPVRCSLSGNRGPVPHASLAQRDHAGSDLISDR